jgi:para-nitrobenzyl esterase
MLYLGKAIFGRNAALEQAGSDMILACPIGAEASLTAAAGRKAFLYKFNRSVPGAGEGTVGAFHSIELPYVFNTFDSAEWKWLPVTQADRVLSGTIETYWTNFAKTGDPNSPGQPVWNAWSNKGESYLEFTKEGRVVAQQGFSPAFCFLSPDRLKRQLSSSK